MVVIFLVDGIVVSLAVIIHYEFPYRLTIATPKLRIKHRSRIVLGVFGALIAHAVEVWIFAGAYYFMNHSEGWGRLEGRFTGSLLDCGYFSFTTFTTLGFGDIEPVGALRYLTGIEALTGLVLITWTASFPYIEMMRSWIPSKTRSVGEGLLDPPFRITDRSSVIESVMAFRRTGSTNERHGNARSHFRGVANLPVNRTSADLRLPRIPRIVPNGNQAGSPLVLLATFCSDPFGNDETEDRQELSAAGPQPKRPSEMRQKDQGQKNRADGSGWPSGSGFSICEIYGYFSSSGK